MQKSREEFKRRATRVVRPRLIRGSRSYCLMLLLLITPVVSGSPSRAEVSELSTVYGALPLLRSLAISPDGNWIAGVGVVGNRPSIVVAPFATQQFEPIAMLKNDFDRIDWVEWANKGRVVFSSSSPTVKAGRVYRQPSLGSVDVDGSNYVQLKNEALYVKNPMSGRMMGLVHNLPEDPNHILVNAYDFRERGNSVFRVNVYDSDFEKVFSPTDDINSVSPNESGQLLYGATVDKLIAKLFYRPSEKSPFQEIYEFSLADGQGGLGIVGTASVPDKLLVLTNLETDKTVLAEFDVAARELTEVVFEDSRYDVGNALYWDGQLHAIVIPRDFPEYALKSPRFETALGRAKEALGQSDLLFVDSTRDFTKIIVAAGGERGVPSFYALDFEKNIGALLASTYPAAARLPRASTKSHWIKARDGEDINVFVTMPSTAGGNKHPVIVFPHGGPNARDFSGFDPFVQYFSSLGYVVLQVNFRGSSGFGRAYEKAGFMQWGKRMQNDVIDAFRWLNEKELADTNRSCVVGASYGGYVALTASFQTPDLFNCYVSIAGVSDIEALLKSEFYSGSQISKEVNAIRHGDTAKDVEYMRSQSLIHNISDVRGPILLVHGTLDTRVKLDQSKLAYRALKKAKVDVELLTVRNGTHYLDDQKNRQLVFRAIGEFLGTHL